MNEVWRQFRKHKIAVIGAVVAAAIANDRIARKGWPTTSVAITAARRRSIGILPARKLSDERLRNLYALAEGLNVG